MAAILRFSLSVERGLPFAAGLQAAITQMAAIAVALNDARVESEFLMMDSRNMLIRFKEEKGAVFFKLRFGGEHYESNAKINGWSRLS